jgi:acyl carrier protein
MTPTTPDTVRQELRTYVEEEFMYLHPDLELSDTDDLLAKGVIDSLGFVELVEEIQARYGIAVDDVEITAENFGSLDAMAKYVARRRASAAEAA